MSASLTKTERVELSTIVRLRARLAREDATARHAELLARFEEDLAREYEFGDTAWSDLTKAAGAKVAEADAELAGRCAALGIRPEFRPQLNIGWWSRGQNGAKERRAELRKVAVRRLDAMLKVAKTEITRGEVEARTAIASTALTSVEASQFLDNLPTAEALMPRLTLEEVEGGEAT